MKCYKPTTMRSKCVKMLKQPGQHIIRQDGTLGTGTMSEIDKKVDIIQKKLQETKLQPIRGKLKAIKLAL